MLTGLLAGIFPALHFANLNPVEALKNKISKRGSSFGGKKALSIFQFALSFGFILSLVVFSRQYKYSLNFDFGFEKQNIVNVHLQNEEPLQIVSTFSRLAVVKSVSLFLA